MKILLSLALLLFSAQAISQAHTTLYFDTNMQPSSKKKAAFFGTGFMEDGLYN